MRVMILDHQDKIENLPLKLKEVRTPEPSVNEVRIKVNTCGICRTDLHIIEGDLPVHKLPLIPGHQVAGFVEKIGKNVQKFKINDRVGAPWLYKTCGTCFYCKHGRENLCENALFTGYDVDGGYAEYFTISEDYIYHLPENYTDEEVAPFLCGGVIGYYAFTEARVEQGDKLGLFGLGSSAHITLQVANHKGIDVYVVARKQRDFELAYELGAKWSGKIEDLNEKLNSVIVFAPSGELMVNALEKIIPGGRVVSAGIYASQLPAFDYNHIYPEKSLTSIANTTRANVKEFLKVASEFKIKTKINLYLLNDANIALQNIKHSKVSGSSILKVF
jgi:propanol-preferring alcohol dehydrogenase